MKIFITGAGGNLGQSLVKALTNTDIKFLALPHTELDITNQQAVIACANDYRPDIIINAAAYTLVEKAEDEYETAHQINGEGAKNLAQAAQLINAAIFHISTDYVFAGDASTPYQEHSPAQPQTIYGQSKLAGELAVKETNPRHIILRTSWLFSEYGNNFLRTLLQLGKERQVLDIVNDQRGAPTYAGDLAMVLLQLAKNYHRDQQLPWGTYHYCGAPYLSWYEFAIAIFQQAAAQGLYTTPIPIINPISSKDYPTQVQRPLNSQLDCRKIQSTFGIAPRDWQAALRDLSAFL